MCLHACLHHHNALFLLYSPIPFLSISSKLFLCLLFLCNSHHCSFTSNNTHHKQTHSQIWSHTFLQTYGTNLPTSLTYFLLFHQRLLTSETCCGLRYGLASLSTTSVTRHTSNQAHQPPALLLPLFTSQSQPFFHRLTPPVSPQVSYHAILHVLPLLQSIHFLGTPVTLLPLVIHTIKHKQQTTTNTRGLLTKDNFYGNGDCCRGIPSCCHPSPGHTTSNTNNHHTSLHSTCQHHTSCHPNTNPRYVILNTFPFQSPASPTKRPLLFPRVAPTLQHRLTLGCLPFP